MGVFCTIFRARPVGTGIGAKFGRKPAKTQNQNYNTVSHPSPSLGSLMMRDTSQSILSVHVAYKHKLHNNNTFS